MVVFTAVFRICIRKRIYAQKYDRIEKKAALKIKLTSFSCPSNKIKTQLLIFVRKGKKFYLLKERVCQSCVFILLLGQKNEVSLIFQAAHFFFLIWQHF